MQGAVQSCVTCRVQYALHQSMRKSFRDASEMCQKSTEFDMQGHTLTSPPSKRVLLVIGNSYGMWGQSGSEGANLTQHQGHWPSDWLAPTHYQSLAIPWTSPGTVCISICT